MTRGNFIATGLALLLLVMLGLVANDVAWGRRKPKATAQQQAETARTRDRGGEEAVQPGETAEERWLAHWRTRRVTLPDSVVEAMELKSFDEASGELSPALLEALRVTLPEREKLAAVTSVLMGSFQAVEMQVAEVREGVTSDAAGRCLVMPPCEDAARPLLEGFRTEVEGLLGKERGTTFFLLTRKELRHGGRDGMWARYDINHGSRRVSFGGYVQGQMGYPLVTMEAVSLKEMRRYNRLAGLLDE